MRKALVRHCTNNGDVGMHLCTRMYVCLLFLRIAHSSGLRERKRYHGVSRGIMRYHAVAVSSHASGYVRDEILYAHFSVENFASTASQSTLTHEGLHRNMSYIHFK